MEDNTNIYIHNKLNEIYSMAESAFEFIKNESDLKASYGFFSGNYININGIYEYQKYPIPVISVEGKGDVGFNIDYIWFEFFLNKDAFNNADIETLINEYKIEIYGGKDCLKDFYFEGKSISSLFHDVNISKEETICIAIYFKDVDEHSVKDIFLSLCDLLKL